MRARSARVAAGVVTLTAGILALPASLATAATGQHTHATTSGGTWTWTQGVHLLAGKTYSLTEIRAKQAAVNASQRAQQLKLDPAPTAKPATAKPAATVTPFTVASGYVMHDPGYRRDDHNYDSTGGQLARSTAHRAAVRSREPGKRSYTSGYKAPVPNCGA